MGKGDDEIDTFVLQALFSTLTNVNFDSERFVEYCNTADAHLKRAAELYKAAGGTEDISTTNYELPTSDRSIATLEALGADRNSVWRRRKDIGEDAVGLVELIQYGIKGAAAYHEHNVEITGKPDAKVMAVVTKALDLIAETPAGGYDIKELTATALGVGAANLDVLAGLDAAHLEQYGTPQPTQVDIMPVAGKCILVSGHDLKDLQAILEQTQGKGIDVYTHGELLPAHGYPELKKYEHLRGNYGGAWQLQKMDFAGFPGPIVMTSNCIIEPRKSYRDRMFTRGSVGWPGVKHIEGRDFSEVISQALELDGFQKDSKVQRKLTVGFGKDAVLAAAPAIVDEIQKGNIKHFFFIGGCDGSEGERSYFTDLALAAPKESVILTAGCGKYRFNKYDHGTTAGGIPRLVDMGQCNDSYGAVVVALALKDAMGVESVNDLPLSFAVSWFEQKAVAVLLTLLHLGVKNIHLGPNLPAFVSPAVLDVLVQNFGLRPTNPDVNAELQNMLGGK
jgi:hydroxylamine reductase